MSDARQANGVDRRLFVPLVMLVVGAQLLHTRTTSPAWGQPPSDRSFQQTNERLRRAVFARPQASAAFDRWFDNHLAADKQQQLVDDVQAHRAAHPDDPNAQQVWAMVCERVGQWDAAAAAWQRAQYLAPQDYFPRWRLAQLRLRQDQAQQAIEVLIETLHLPVPRAQRFAIATQLATLHEQAGRADLAAQVWEQLANHYASEPKVLGDLAVRLQNLGDDQSARRLWTAVVDQSTHDPETRFRAETQLAQLRLTQGDLDAGIAELTRLLDQLQPDSWRAAELRRVIQRAVVDRNGFQGLIQFWRQRLERHPQDLSNHIRLAEALLQADQLPEATAQLKEALAKAPTDRQIHELLIASATRQGDFRAAVQHARSLASAHANEADLWIQLGKLEMQQSGLDRSVAEQQAMASWTHAAEIRPQDAALAFQVAEVCRAAALLGVWNDQDSRPTDKFPRRALERNPRLLAAAESFYREALRREPSAAYREQLAEFLHRLDRGAEAIEILMPRLDERSAADWQVAANWLTRYGYTKQAAEAAAEAVRADPSNPIHWQQRCHLLLAIQRPDEAIAVCEQMAQQAATFEWQQQVAELRVAATVAASQVEQRRQFLEQRLDQDPRDRPALWELALLWDATRQTERALPLLKRLVEQEPRNANLVRRYADVLEAANHQEEAAQVLGALIANDVGRHQEDTRHLIDLYMQQGKLAAARELTERLIRAAPRDVDLRLLMATVSTAQADLAGQIDALQAAVELAPRDVQVRRQFASALVQRGRTREALEQSLAALEAATTLAERNAVLIWILSWAHSPDEHLWLRQQIEQLLWREEAPRDDLRRCLALLLQQTNQPADALTLLVELQRQHPLDVSLLQQLVELADRMQRFDMAVTFQQQIVRLEETPASHERLATLFRQNGQLAEATQTWDRLLQLETTEAEAARLVEDQLERAELLPALRLAEAAWARDPKDGLMAYRVALLHLALGHSLSARQAIQQFLLIAAPTAAVDDEATTRGAATATGAPKEADLQRLELAALAHHHFAKLIDYQARYGRQHRLTVQAYIQAVLLRPAPAVNLQAARVFASAAWSLLLNEPDALRALEAFVADENTPRQVVSEVLVTTWLAGETAIARPLANRLIAQQPEDELPHVLRVLSPVRANSNGWQLSELEASYNWLRQYEPQWAAELRPVVARQLRESVGDPLRVDLVRAELARSTSLSELAEWEPALAADEDPARESLRTEFLERADQLHRENPTAPLPQQHARDLLRIALASSAPSIPDRVEFIQALLVRYLNASVDAIQQPLTQLNGLPQFGTTGRPRAAGTIIQRLIPRMQDAIQAQLAAAISRPIPPSRDENSQELTTDHWFHWLRILDSDDSQLAVVHGRAALVAVPRSRSNETVRPPIDAGRFPCAIRSLDWESLSEIERTAEALSDASERHQLLDRLRQSATSTETPARDNLHYAEVVLLWHWDQREAARDQLEQIGSAHADDVPWQMVLVRADLELDRLADAQRRLQSIDQMIRARALDAATRQGLNDLRSQLWKRWSRRAHRRDLEGHAGAVTSLAMHPEGRLLASGGVDGTVRIWDIQRGELIQTLGGPADRFQDIVLAVAFAPKGDLLAAAGYDRVVRRWQVADWKPVSAETSENYQTTLRALAFSPDGSVLAVGGEERSVWLAGAISNSIASLAGHRDAVLALRFAPTGSLLASASADQTVRLWDLNERRELATLASGRGAVRALAYSSTNNLWLTAGDGHQVNIWHHAAGAWQLQRSWTIDSIVRSLDCAVDSDRVVIGGDDHLVQVWDLRTNSPDIILQGHAGRVLAVWIASDGRRVASAGIDGVIKLWELPDKLALDKESD